MFNRGYYELGDLPSRQIAQRDLSGHSRLKLRKQGVSSVTEESTEEKLLRLKQELEARESKISSAPRIEAPVVTTTTAFDDQDEVVSSSSSDHEGEEEESELDAALKRELASVKLAKKLRLEAEESNKASAPAAAAAVLHSNPLLQAPAGLTRRWDDDVVFRNQSRGEVSKKEPRLINDTTKSDLHRDFLKRNIL